MSVGFPVVAAATGLAAVFVLAQAVQGLDGPENPDVGPTVVLPAAAPDEPGAEEPAATTPADPVAPRVRAVPKRDRTTEVLPSPTGEPRVAADDPAGPRPTTPRPRRSVPSLSAAPTPRFVPDPAEQEPTQIPVPVCPAEDGDNSREDLDREDPDGDGPRDWRRDRRWDRSWDRENRRDRERPDSLDRRDRGCRD
ncbi:MAG: hypothetical protein ACT4QF_00200 [Sporichthyaceae bacterium]